MAEEYRVSAKACAKMILHAAKYPFGEVCGLAIGKAPSSSSSSTDDKTVFVEDVVPLFHKNESATSPLLEVALSQVSLCSLDIADFSQSKCFCYGSSIQ